MEYEVAEEIVEAEIEMMRVGNAYIQLNYNEPPERLHIVVQPMQEPQHIFTEYVFTWEEGMDVVQMQAVSSRWNGMQWVDKVLAKKML